MDYEKCAECKIPINYCDGMTRYKCGKERKDLKSYCIFQDE